jgi:hypothetical protein
MLARSALVAVLAAFVWSCSSVSPIADPDTATRSRLVGKWQELRMFDREVHQHHITMHQHGTFEHNGNLHEPPKLTPFTWRGTWRVKDGKFIYTTTFSKPEGMYKPGETFEDKIDSVSEDEWVMIEQSTGGKSRAYRVK